MAEGDSLLVEGTPVVYQASGGDKDWDIGGTLADGVAIGPYMDLGAAPRPDEVRIEVVIDGCDAAPNEGETVLVTVSESEDSTTWDGRPTTAPTVSAAGTMTTGQLKNMGTVGVPVAAVSTTAADVLQDRGTMRVTSRYLAPVIHNQLDVALKTAGNHKITITPLYYQGQSS